MPAGFTRPWLLSRAGTLACLWKSLSSIGLVPPADCKARILLSSSCWRICLFCHVSTVPVSPKQSGAVHWKTPLGNIIFRNCALQSTLRINHQSPHLSHPFSPFPSFFFASFSFFLLRPLLSLFLRLDIPVLNTSAYRTKNLSTSSGCTIVESLIFSPFWRLSLDLPFVARMIKGRGWAGWRSGKGAVDEGGVGGDEGY